MSGYSTDALLHITGLSHLVLLHLGVLYSLRFLCMGREGTWRCSGKGTQIEGRVPVTFWKQLASYLVFIFALLTKE